MGFDFQERSNHDGAPIGLYAVSVGHLTWFYNSSDADVVHDSVLYKSCPISDTGFVQSGDTANDEFTVTLPENEPVVEIYQGTPPSAPGRIIMRTKHVGDRDAPIMWVGAIVSVKRVLPAQGVISCQPATGSFNRAGLRLAWSRGCPHALYDSQCRVNPEAFRTTAIIRAMTGDAIVADAFGANGDDWLSGGFVKWVRPNGLTEFRPIELHKGLTCYMLGTTDGMSVGMQLSVYPGCARTSNACLYKFNNLANYGGFPFLPGKSPFTSDPIF